jgi:hypothetical protein
MEDLLGLLFVFIFFILGPLIEHLRKKQQPPQNRRPTPQQRPPTTASRTEEARSLPQSTDLRTGSPRPPQRPRAEEMAEAESATTMLPDELWAVLTGQPVPQRRPAPLPPGDLDVEEFDVERETSTEDVSVEVRRNRTEEAVSLEATPRRYDPVVVSMEENVPDTKTRHAAFHQKIQQAPVAKVKRAPSPASLVLSDVADLRKAFLLQAILGRPKGLE